MENGCCDVIRARYRVPPHVVDVAFANLIFAMRIVGRVRQPNETPLEAANRVLRLAFDESQSMDFPIPIHLMQINDADGTEVESPAYGCHDVSKASYSFHSPHWVDFLCWWLRPDEVGFISMEGYGERRMAVESPSAEANKYWFSPPPKK